MKATASAVLAACLACVPAAAQDGSSAGEPKVITVTANVQLSVPIDPSATTADTAKALAQANDTLSGLAERECELMAAAFKRECRLAQINVNANLNMRRLAQQFGAEANPARRVANANMNLTMELTAPANAAEPAPAAK